MIENGSCVCRQVCRKPMIVPGAGQVLWLHQMPFPGPTGSFRVHKGELLGVIRAAHHELRLQNRLSLSGLAEDYPINRWR